MTFKVFVDGQEGTTGLRIHEYLAQRTDIDVLKIDADKRKDRDERARLLNAADVAFLCLPDDASREAATLVKRLEELGVTDVIVGFRDAYQMPQDTEPLQAKVDALRMFGDTVIAEVKG